jgi:hypothetical protein
LICEDCAPTAIIEALSTVQVQVYPNPTKGNVWVRFSGTEPALTVVVRNIQGQVVARKQVTPNGSPFDEKVDLSGNASGIYFLSLEAESSRITTKIVLE